MKEHPHVDAEALIDAVRNIPDMDNATYKNPHLNCPKFPGDMSSVQVDVVHEDGSVSDLIIPMLNRDKEQSSLEALKTMASRWPAPEEKTT